MIVVLVVMGLTIAGATLVYAAVARDRRELEREWNPDNDDDVEEDCHRG